MVGMMKRGNFTGWFQGRKMVSGNSSQNYVRNPEVRDVLNGKRFGSNSTGDEITTTVNIVVRVSYFPRRDSEK